MKKTIILILAIIQTLIFTSCGAQSSSSSGKAADAEKTAVMSYREYSEAAIGAPVTVDTFVQAKQSLTEGKATFYTQSEDGAYFIYQMPCTKEEYDTLSPGTKIRVSGKKSEWSGEIEITEATFQIIDGKFIAEPADVTALIGAEDLAAYQNKYVKFSKMTVEPKTDSSGEQVAFLYNWDGSGKDGDDLYFDASAGGEKLTFTVESSLCGPDTDVYKAVKSLKVGDTVDLNGFLYWYNGANPHIVSVSAAND